MIFLFNIRNTMLMYKNDPVKREDSMQTARGKNCWSSVLEGIAGTRDLMHSGGHTLAGFAGKIFPSNSNKTVGSFTSICRKACRGGVHMSLTSVSQWEGQKGE